MGRHSKSGKETKPPKPHEHFRRRHDEVRDAHFHKKKKPHGEVSVEFDFNRSVSHSFSFEFRPLFPEFKKLWRRIDHGVEVLSEAVDKDFFREKVPKGKYMVEIEYNFAVKSFQGTKNVVIANTSSFGGAATFLGLTYIITGGVCLCLGVFLLIIKVSIARMSKFVHTE